MEEKFINDLKEAFEIEDREIQLSDKFKEYPEWDSLAQLTLVAMLDENYEVSIETDELKGINTVQDLLNEVIKRKQ